MPILAIYKAASAILLILTGAVTAGTTFYYQQLNNELKNDLSNLTAELDSSNSQIETLESRVSQLNNLLSQLITNLTETSRTFSTPISTGTIYLVGYGGTEYVPFTVTDMPARLNLTFTSTSPPNAAPTIAMLLSQSQYDIFVDCNCVFTGNYTDHTWESPNTASYQVIIDIPHTGAWYLAFLQPTGTGSERWISQTLTLLTNQ